MKNTINYLKYFQKASLISETIDYSNESYLFWVETKWEDKIKGICADLKYKNIYSGISKQEITKENKKSINKKFEKEISKKQSLKLLMSPFSFYKNNKLCHPFLIPVELKGMDSKYNNLNLKPTSLPRISRDCLDFFSNNGSNIFSLNELEVVIKQHSANDIFQQNFDPEHWNYFINYYIGKLSKFSEKNNGLDFVSDKIYFFEEKGVFNFNKNYEDVIEVLEERNENLELFDLLTKNENTNYKSDYNINDMINKLENEKSTSFLGQIKVNKIGSNEYYSLNRNQRIFLNALNKEKVTALNGPPGTGKTTALQSVIATKVVNSFLSQEKMPIFFGVSATNQAKDNIIEGFKYSEIHDSDKRSMLFDRWVDLETANLDYGIPFNGNDVILENYDVFLTREAYVSLKQKYLINNAKFLSEVKNNILDIFDWTSFTVRDLLGLESIFNVKLLIPSSFLKQVNDLKTAKTNLHIFANNIYNLLEETENKKRELISSLRLVEKVVNDSEHEIGEVFAWYKEKIDDILKHLLNVFEEKNNKIYTINEAECISNNIRKIYSEYEKTINEKKFLDVDIIYREISYVIDNLFKPVLFHLAMRYYEASFIIELGNVLNNKKLLNNNGVFKDNFKSEKYKLFSNISPVFVSTMNSLPKEMNVPSFYKNDEGEWDKINDYLFNFIDYLIIDEAGQCNTEKGAINFLFAKKSIIVGDTDQIEPVFSISESEDFNSINQFFNNKMDIHEFCLQPYNTHNGNVMKMAQNVSRYSPYFEVGLSKGLYLLEHRRCRREVIEYCNELVYKNKLEYPGNDRFSDFKKSDLYLKDQTPWGFINVEGKVEKRGTSSTNKIEAEHILEWIDENYKELTSKGKKLKDVIAILTCFSAQESVIKQAIYDKNTIFKNPSLKNELKEVTIGTAHKLQGAERPIILFSLVYDKSSVGKLNFMDRSKNIINVAVSRSKQSFYVFGDKDVLSKAKKDSSTYILWKYLNK